jgi:hypothetical protein
LTRHPWHRRVIARVVGEDLEHRLRRGVEPPLNADRSPHGAAFLSRPIAASLTLSPLSQSAINSSESTLRVQRVRSRRGCGMNETDHGGPEGVAIDLPVL